MVQEFVSAMVPWMIAVHVLSVALLIVALLLFSQTRFRRKALIQTLAITSDDDDAVMHQWTKTDRRQRRLRAWYACSIVGIAIVSTIMFASLPYWL